LDRSDIPLRTAPTPARANEWALVLTSQGVPATVRRGGEGYSLLVPPAEAERAAEILARYEAENPPGARTGRARAASPPVWTGSLPANAALAVSVALVVFFVSVTGPRDPAVVWFARGSADAARILAGEWWRAITALTLHADLSHVLSNAVIGGFFVAWVLRSRGPGLGLLLVVLSGVAGNLLNACLRSAGHVAVGASTSGFGAVGLLAGIGAVQRGSGRSWARGRWVPLAAGLGILAMFGSSAATDIWAHLFGFAAGVGLGALSARWQVGPPGGSAQIGLAALALGLVLVGWSLALS
jgi:membrane associated rhomboid family serine protease